MVNESIPCIVLIEKSNDIEYKYLLKPQITSLMNKYFLRVKSLAFYDLAFAAAVAPPGSFQPW